MSLPARPAGVLDVLIGFLGDSRFVTALATASIGVGVAAFALRQTIGWGGLIGMLVAIVLLAGAVFAVRRRTVQWRGILPISLLLFLAWAGLSIFWSQYHWATLAGLAYLTCFTAIGLFVALLRDTIQIVRAYGDVFRFALAVSLSLEIIAGALIDSPIRFLGVLGTLGQLGPIQGIMGARNQLGILAVLAIVTFVAETLTHSVSPTLSRVSLVLAVVTVLLTRSPLAFGALGLVVLAAGALYLLRRLSIDARRIAQLALLAATILLAAGAWVFRSAIVTIFNAGGELTYRIELWYQAWSFIGLKELLGWGWLGPWREDIPPYQAFVVGARGATTASNAFVDVWLQLGLIGISLFVVLVALSFTRSWLLATNQRSIVYVWPALVLLVLLVTSLAESSLLFEYGWLTFVVCTIKAAEQLSWRNAFAQPLDSPLD